MPPFSQLFVGVVLIIAARGHRVVESVEERDPSPSNTTTLYPVTSKNSTAGTKLKSATSWKIETTYSAPKLNTSSEMESKEVPEASNSSTSSQEFKPSQHIGFVDEDSLEVPSGDTPSHFNVVKKPPVGFISSSKENYKSAINKIPKEIFKHYQEFPYKFEPAILTRAKDGWKPTNVPAGPPSTQDPKPTAPVPVKVPAGGLYQLPDPFKDKPGDFGLDFTGEEKEHGLKKRVNPMKNLLHLLTALIPVGIIFSALTPSVITIHPDQQTGPGPGVIPLDGGGPGTIFRRADGSVAQLPNISDRCKRRLLCEIHSDYNYSSSSSNRRKQCHRLRCEDPEALSRTLQWLLAHTPTSGHNGDHFT